MVEMDEAGFRIRPSFLAHAKSTGICAHGQRRMFSEGEQT
jgi:hypothetical protein